MTKSRTKIAIVTVVAALGGCRTYVLQGWVVQGDVSDMAFVQPDDPRLSQPGVSSVRISVERDPDRLSATIVGTDMSDTRGAFTMGLNTFGAGYLIETFRIHASKAGYRSAEAHLSLDANDERPLLVILAPGQSDPYETETLLEQYERFR